MRRALLIALPLAIVALALDQATKVWTERAFALGESLPLLPFLSFTYVRNQGAAWGMFQGAHYVLAAFGIVAALAICLFWRKLFGPHPRLLPAVGLLLAGIVGNVIDRVRLGYVVDFIHVHWGSWHFPCFNIADSAICIAVGLLILLQWERKR